MMKEMVLEVFFESVGHVSRTEQEETPVLCWPEAAPWRLPLNSAVDCCREM